MTNRSSGGLGPATDELPDGFVVAIRDDVIVSDGGRLLIGGSPMRAMRLTAAARSQLSVEASGAPIVRVTHPAGAVLARRLLDANLADPLPESNPAGRDQLTVVIPVRDRSEQLARALDSLAGLRCIVVDDASRDPEAVARVVAERKAHLVVLDRNLGPAGARNRGLLQVTTRYVAFVDSDVTADPEVLAALTAHFADPAVAVVGPFIRGTARSANPRWFERYDEEASSLGLGTRACSVRPRAAVAWLPSACLVARVEALQQPTIGGFDESRRVGEDVDLIWRLVDAGWRVRYDPAAVVHHDARGTFCQWFGRKYFYGTGSAQLARTHGAKLAPAELSAPMAVAATALLARRAWSLPVAAVAITHAGASLNRTLPAAPGRPLISARLALRGTGWALRQEADLLLRHWWPLAVSAATLNKTARRAFASALVVDLVVAFTVQRRRLNPATAIAGRWSDNLAYGAGLWVGATRQGSFRALVPRRAGQSRHSWPGRRHVERLGAPGGQRSTGLVGKAFLAHATPRQRTAAGH